MHWEPRAKVKISYMMFQHVENPSSWRKRTLQVLCCKMLVRWMRILLQVLAWRVVAGLRLEGLQKWHDWKGNSKWVDSVKTEMGWFLVFWLVIQLLGTKIFWMQSMNPIARTPRKSSGSFDAEEVRQNLSARYAVMDEDLQEKRVEGGKRCKNTPQN